MRALIDTVVAKKIRPKCDRLYEQPRRKALLRFVRTATPVCNPAANASRRLT
jgi:hypothetical protein